MDLEGGGLDASFKVGMKEKLQIWLILKVPRGLIQFDLCCIGFISNVKSIFWDYGSQDCNLAR